MSEVASGKSIAGQRFGKLIAVEETEGRGAGGSVVWRCVCDCGNEILSTRAQLIKGYRKSCGCMSHPTLKDYVGKQFGQLTVVEYAGKEKGMHRWRCLCSCGKSTVVGQSLLQSGKTKSCGCLARPKAKDLKGKQFGQLTVIRFEENREGRYLWRCHCACGNETVVQQYNLISGKTKSCGCLQSRIILDTMQFVDGTSIARIKSAGKTVSSNNTSGVNGVYWNRKSGKWIAQIGFKKKTYYLGSFMNKDDAIRARKRAEERLYGEFLESNRVMEY